MKKVTLSSDQLDKLIKEEVYRKKCWAIIEAKVKKDKDKKAKSKDGKEAPKETLTIEDIISSYKASNTGINNVYGNIIPQIEKIESFGSNAKPILPVFNKNMQTFQKKELVVSGYLAKMWEQNMIETLDPKQQKSLLEMVKKLAKNQSNLLDMLKKLELEAKDTDTKEFFSEEEPAPTNALSAAQGVNPEKPAATTTPASLQAPAEPAKEEPKKEEKNENKKGEKVLKEGVYDTLKDTLDKINLFLTKWYDQVREIFNQTFTAQDDFIRMCKDILRHA